MAITLTSGERNGREWRKRGHGGRNRMRERGSEGGTGQRDKNGGITEGSEDSSGC